MKRYLAIVVFAVLTAACGGAESLGSVAPSGTVSSAGDTGSAGKLTGRYVPGVNSCPDGELVRNIRVNVNRGGAALIQWDEVASIREYVVRVARYQTGATESTTSVKQASVKLRMSDSTYIVYVRTQNDCGGYGPEGDGVVFSIDGPPDAPVVPVVVTPPEDEDGGGDIDIPPPSDPGGGNDEGNNGNGNGNGGGNGTGNEGNGNGPPVLPPTELTCGVGFHKAPIAGTHPAQFECVADGDPATGDSQTGNGNGHGHGH